MAHSERRSGEFVADRAARQVRDGVVAESAAPAERGQTVRQHGRVPFKCHSEQ